MDIECARLALFTDTGLVSESASGGDRNLATPMQEEYKKRLAEGLNVSDGSSSNTPSVTGSRFLYFTQEKDDQENLHFEMQDSDEPAFALSQIRKRFRSLPKVADKILDAPDLLDDYYLNLLDWGSRNVLAVALDSKTYLYNTSSGDIQQLMECDEEECVTSVAWADDGRHLTVGTSTSRVQHYDAETLQLLRQLPGHSSRVSSMSWSRSDILSTGSRDSLIINHDLRFVVSLDSKLWSTVKEHNRYLNFGSGSVH